MVRQYYYGVWRVTDDNDNNVIVLLGHLAVMLYKN